MTASLTAPFGDEQLREIRDAAQAGYPNETCGLFVGRDWTQARHVAMENIQDRYHARDPERFPRTARTAYLVHPLRLLEQVEAGGGLLCIWHSHCDVGAYFSEEDVKVALGGGEAPLWPGTSYLVISCRHGRGDGAKLFTWAADRHAFTGVDVALPA